MPPADIRQLRDLMRYRFKLTCFKSSEKNRLQNCLTVSNIQLGNVVSDTFGKSAQAILDKLLENPADTSFDLEPLVYKNLKKKFPELRDAIDGYITPEQAGKLKIIKAHYEDLESRKAELEELILALAAPYQPCHSSNHSWYQQRLHFHRNHLRNRYQYGGFPFGETLMFMGRAYPN